jgi:hypothetical protein
VDEEGTGDAAHAAVGTGADPGAGPTYKPNVNPKYGLNKLDKMERQIESER